MELMGKFQLVCLKSESKVMNEFLLLFNYVFLQK